MLMVLMALIELGRTKVHKATRWLWMALSGGLGAGVAGCFEEPKVLYGPPPTDDVGDVTLLDVPPVDSFDPGQVPLYGPPDAVPLQDCQPAVYYGPQPCDTDQQCVEREGPGWYCDKSAGVEDPCKGFVSWPVCKQGTQPLDVIDNDVPDVPKTDCEPAVYYGPPPCDTDEDCKQYGANWYCDKNAGFSDPCGGQVSWPTCKEGSQPMDVIDNDVPTDVPDCPPVAWYGPPPCETDDQCRQQYGADWYCDKGGGVQDPCAGWIAYPQCRQAVDAMEGDVPADAEVTPDVPVVFYGPQPVDPGRAP